LFVVNSNITNNTIENFSILIDGKTYNTTNGSIDIYSIAGAYNVNLSVNGYVDQSIDINVLNETFQYYTITPYPSGTLNITFIDSDTGNIITTTNITIDFVSDTYNQRNFTSTGNIVAQGLQPEDYVIRFIGDSDYTSNEYVYTLPEETYQELTLYMSNDTIYTSIDASVIDEIGNPVIGAIIKVYEYDGDTGNYILIQTKTTNFEGETILSVKLNSEYYKFVIEYPSGTVELTTGATQVISTSIQFQITIGTTVGSIYYTIDNITATPITYNNATNSFSWTVNEAPDAVTQFCLKVYRVLNTQDVLFNSSCTTTESIFTLGVLNESGRNYKAVATVLIEGRSYVWDIAYKTFVSSNIASSALLFWVVLLTIIIIMAGIWNPTVALILTPLPITIANLTGLVVINWGVLGAVWLLFLIIAGIAGGSQ